MCSAILLSALLLCLGPAWARSSRPAATVLSGRVLGPLGHLTLAARLDTSGSASCLRLEDTPPTFKCAFPVNAQLQPLHRGAEDMEICSENDTIRNIIESWDGSPEALCATATHLLASFTGGAGDAISTNCTEEKGSPSSSVFVQGLIDGEPSAAWLQVSPQQINITADRVEDSYLRKQTPLFRARRSGEADELQVLQNCIYEHRDAALPSDEGGEVILVVGTTGVGKSTLVTLITDNDQELKSVESSPGNFIIEDESNKIGSGTNSQTTVPELFTDKRNGFKVYDFPGFSDTRGSCSDIVTASVLQKVARSASAVKVVLVVPYYSMRSGSDRLGFISLLRHATAFIRNPSKYKDSVGLVVTKVPNIYRKNKGLVSDKDMRIAVVSFLRDVNGTLPGLQKSKSDPPEFYPAASKLISNIVESDGDDYPRIGLFRMPDEEGVLNELETMQKAKSSLQNLFYSVLTPSSPEDDDFGLPLSDTAKFSVQRLQRTFTSRLENHVAKIALALKEHFRVARQQLLDITAVREQAERNARVLAGALDRVLAPSSTNSSTTTPREFLRRLLAAVREVHQGAPAVDFLASLNDTAVLELLQDATPEDLEGFRPEQCSAPLQDVMSYVNGVDIWYKLLDTLETLLSEPKVQRDDALKLRILQKYEMHDNNEKMNPLFGILVILNEQDIKFSGLAELNSDIDMLRDLGLLLNATLRPEHVQYSCIPKRSGWSFKVRGRFVWTSEVLRKVREGCKQPITAVYIQAEHTLFLDADLNLHSEKSVKAPATLLVFSPKWQVLGHRTLSLDGLPGERLPQLQDGTGQHGLAGLPGGPGGSIVALAEEVVNGQHLQLRANGGSGGPGQDGASGLDGRNGQDGSVGSSHPCDSELNFGLGYLWGSFKNEDCGSRGASGLDGGNGGVGGFGGKAGSIHLFPFRGPPSYSGPDQSVWLSTVKILHRDGPRGAAGGGGAGGKGGFDGDTIVYTKHYFLFMHWDTRVKQRIPGGKRSDGQIGKSGASTFSLRKPDELENNVCVESYFVSVHNGILKNLWDRVTAGKARHILGWLDSLIAGALEACKEAVIVQQITAMEHARAQQSQTPGFAARLLPRYEASLGILNQILNKQHVCKEHLLAARTAALSSVRAMRSPAGAQLIVDVKSFLVSSSRAVQQFYDSKEKVDLFENVGTSRQRISEKISRRRELLLNHVQPAIATAVQRLQIVATSALPLELTEETEQVRSDKRLIADQHRRIRETAFRAKAIGLISTIVTACIGWFSTDSAIVEGALQAATSVGGAGGLLPGASVDEEQISKMFSTAKDLMQIVSGDEETLDAGNVLRKVTKIAGVVSNLQSQVDGKDSTTEPVIGAANQKAASTIPVHDSEKMAAAVLTVQEQFLIRREEWLRVMDNSVRKSIVPLLHSFGENIQKIFSGPEKMLAAQSLRAGLGEVRVALAPLTVAHGGLAAPRELQVCAELLDESLGVLVTLLDEIEEYLEHFDTMKSATSLKARLVSWDVDYCSHWKDEDKQKLQGDVALLQEAISANLLLERYNNAMYSFKQWAFPFAPEYLSIMPSVTENQTTENVNGAVSKALTGLTTLLQNMERNHAVVTGHDSKIFTKDFRYPEPLLVWSQTEYGVYLNQMLQGNEVMLLANILASPLHHDAVKFDKIGVRLISTNNSRQAELDRAFEDAMISMTHMGDSYYKCGSQVFTVSVESQEMSFTVKKTADGNPVESNNVYKKLMKGDMMLSPYAVWKVKISGPQTLFNALASFKDQVSLALEGHAQYVNGMQCDESSLKNYYDAVLSKSELNVMTI